MITYKNEGTEAKWPVDRNPTKKKHRLKTKKLTKINEKFVKAVREEYAKEKRLGS